MEILDKQVRDYFEGLSNEDLKQFEDFSLIKFVDIIGYADLDYQSFALNSYVSAKSFELLSDKIKMREQNPEFKGFGDKDANPRIEEEGWGDYTRKIPESEVKALANRILTLREGTEFSKLSLEKMTSIIEAIRQEMRELERTGKDEMEGMVASNNRAYKIDEKYGIDFYQMNRLKDIKEIEKIVHELISQIPQNELHEKMERLEDFRNHPVFHYDSHSREAEDLIANLFGEVNYPKYKLNNILAIDISDALEERIHQIENKKSQGLFARFKNWLKNRKQKRLPEGTEPKSQEDQICTKTGDKESFRDSLLVSKEQSEKVLSEENSIGNSYRNDISEKSGNDEISL